MILSSLPLHHFLSLQYDHWSSWPHISGGACAQQCGTWGTQQNWSTSRSTGLLMTILFHSLKNYLDNEIIDSLPNTLKQPAAVAVTRGRTNSKSQTGFQFKQSCPNFQRDCILCCTLLAVFSARIKICEVFPLRFGHQIFFAEEDSNCCTRQVSKQWWLKSSGYANSLF